MNAKKICRDGSFIIENSHPKLLIRRKGFLAGKLIEDENRLDEENDCGLQ